MTSLFQRIVSAIDHDGSLIPRYPCTGAGSVSLYALSSTANSTLTVRLFAYTTEGNLAAISMPVVFTGSTVADYAGQFTGTPSSTDWLSIDGVGLVGVKVDAVTGGPWTIGVAVTTDAS